MDKLLVLVVLVHTGSHGIKILDRNSLIDGDGIIVSRLWDFAI